MRKYASILIILILFLVCFGSFILAKVIEKPRILFLRKSFNFGKMIEGEKTSTIFYFKNTGTKDLVIKKVRVSCGCTVVSLSSKILKPDEIGELKIKFDSTGLSGDIQKSVYIHSNDPENPIVQLIITGIVKPRS